MNLLNRVKQGAAARSASFAHLLGRDKPADLDDEQASASAAKAEGDDKKKDDDSDGEKAKAAAGDDDDDDDDEKKKDGKATKSKRAEDDDDDADMNASGSGADAGKPGEVRFKAIFGLAEAGARPDLAAVLFTSSASAKDAVAILRCAVNGASTKSSARSRLDERMERQNIPNPGGDAAADGAQAGGPDQLVVRAMALYDAHRQPRK